MPFKNAALGHVGGFILRNSWHDGIEPRLGPKAARGSHSIGYFTGKHSRWDEAAICPNSYNPRNWYACGSATECQDKDTILYAKTSFQPLRLQCADASYCTVAANRTLYLKNSTSVGDDFVRFCFVQTIAGEGADDICLPPMVEMSVPYIVQPVPNEVRENDSDQCGFYFLPYNFIRRVWGRFHGSFVNDFDITWDRESYLINESEFPLSSYEFLRNSTYTQRATTFSGPFPYDFLP